MEKIAWMIFASLVIMIITTIGTGISKKHSINIHPLIIGITWICLPIVPLLIFGYFVEIINGAYIISYLIIITLLLIRYVKYMNIPNMSFIIIPVIYFMIHDNLRFISPDDQFYGDIVDAGSSFWNKFGYSNSHSGIYEKNLYTYVAIPWLYFRSFLSAITGLNPFIVNGVINNLVRFSIIAISLKKMTRHWVLIMILFLLYNHTQWTTAFVRDLDVLFSLSLYMLVLNGKKERMIISITIAMMSSTSIVVLPVLAGINLVRKKVYEPLIITPSLVWIGQDLMLLPIILFCIALFKFAKFILSKIELNNTNSIIIILLLLIIFLLPNIFYTFVNNPELIIIVSTIFLYKLKKKDILISMLLIISSSRIIRYLDFTTESKIMARRLSAIGIYVLMWITIMIVINKYDEWRFYRSTLKKEQ